MQGKEKGGQPGQLTPPDGQTFLVSKHAHETGMLLLVQYTDLTTAQLLAAVDGEQIKLSEKKTRKVVGDRFSGVGEYLSHCGPWKYF